jgi:hypothetical protein
MRRIGFDAGVEHGREPVKTTQEPGCLENLLEKERERGNSAGGFPKSRICSLKFNALRWVLPEMASRTFAVVTFVCVFPYAAVRPEMASRTFAVVT